MNKFKVGDAVRIVGYIPENIDDEPERTIDLAIKHKVILMIDAFQPSVTYPYKIIFSTSEEYWFSEEELEFVKVTNWKEALK